MLVSQASEDSQEVIGDFPEGNEDFLEGNEDFPEGNEDFLEETEKIGGRGEVGGWGGSVGVEEGVGEGVVSVASVSLKEEVVAIRGKIKMY